MLLRTGTPSLDSSRLSRPVGSGLSSDSVSRSSAANQVATLLCQIVEIGFNSQPVVLVTGAFVGAVLAAQGLFQLSGLQMESMGGALVSVGMLRELGPVPHRHHAVGRVGASMAAEIGTMKVTEQIDALRSMSVNPIDYLVTPRFLAMLVSVPLLITEAAALGIGSAWIVGTQTFGVSEAWWVTIPCVPHRAW